jgi:hypothetical protein
MHLVHCEKVSSVINCDYILKIAVIEHILVLFLRIMQNSLSPFSKCLQNLILVSPQSEKVIFAHGCYIPLKHCVLK